MTSRPELEKAIRQAIEKYIHDSGSKMTVQEFIDNFKEAHEKTMEKYRK